MTSKPKGEQARGRADLGMNTDGWQRLFVILRL